MKASMLAVAVFLMLAGGTFSLHAQTNSNVTIIPPNPQAVHPVHPTPFLTPAQRNLYTTAHAKALADNPSLKTEGENLMKKGEAMMSDGLVADKKAFMDMMDAYRQKLRAAMLKEEPKLKATFAEIDKHISEMRGQHLAPVQSSSSSTNAPPVNPSVNR